MIRHTTTRAGTKVFHAPATSYADRGPQRKAPQLHIAGERLEYGWTSVERARVIMAWRRSKSYQSIAEAVGRKEIEVRILVWDLLEDGIIENRAGGFNRQ